MENKYLTSDLLVGKVYKTGLGNVIVCYKENDNYCVCPVRTNSIFVPQLNKWVDFTNLDRRYMVGSTGEFGYCYNNPKTLIQ